MTLLTICGRSNTYWIFRVLFLVLAAPLPLFPPFPNPTPCQFPTLTRLYLSSFGWECVICIGYGASAWDLARIRSNNTNLMNITIVGGYGNKQWESLQIFADTARYLYFNLVNGARMKDNRQLTPSTIYCPDHLLFENTRNFFHLRWTSGCSFWQHRIRQ